MTLASAHHAAPAFNGLLYATVATVIPVLYLAITLQGNLYTRLLQVPGHAMRWLLTRTRIRPESQLAQLIAVCILAPSSSPPGSYFSTALSGRSWPSSA